MLFRSGSVEKNCGNFYLIQNTGNVLTYPAAHVHPDRPDTILKPVQNTQAQHKASAGKPAEEQLKTQIVETTGCNRVDYGYDASKSTRIVKATCTELRVEVTTDSAKRVRDLFVVAYKVGSTWIQTSGQNEGSVSVQGVKPLYDLDAKLLSETIRAATSIGGSSVEFSITVKH